MQQLSDLLKRLRPRPADVVGIDFGSTAIKAVRMRKGAGGSHAVVAAGLLPLGEGGSSGSTDGPRIPSRIALPAKLRARYASLTVPGRNAVIKLLSFPGRLDETLESRVLENLGLQDPADFRVSYKVLREGHARAEARVLAVAIPEVEASAAVSLFSSGLPAPFSLEVSGLATLTAFCRRVSDADDDAVGVLDFGSSSTLIAFFHRGSAALIRQFNVGAEDIVGRVRKTLGVDDATARGIISDGAFDISQPVMDVFTPLIKQLAVSRDFIERREDCRVRALYVPGGVTESKGVQDELRSSLEVDIELWSPFDGMTLSSGAIPEEFKGQEWRLAAATGACLATLEEA